MGKDQIRILIVLALIFLTFLLTTKLRESDGVAYLIPTFTENKIDAGRNSDTNKNTRLREGILVMGRVENSLAQSLSDVFIEIESITYDTVVSVTSINGSYKLVAPFSDSIGISMKMAGMNTLKEQIYIDTETDTLVIDAMISTKGSKLLGVEMY